MKKAHSFSQKSGGMTDIHEPEEQKRKRRLNLQRSSSHLANTIPKWNSIRLGFHSVQMVRNTTHLFMCPSSLSIKLKLCGVGVHNVVLTAGLSISTFLCRAGMRRMFPGRPWRCRWWSRGGASRWWRWGWGGPSGRASWRSWRTAQPRSSSQAPTGSSPYPEWGTFFTLFCKMANHAWEPPLIRQSSSVHHHHQPTYHYLCGKSWQFLIWLMSMRHSLQI